MDGLLWHPEGAANADRGELTAVHQSINSHLGDPHYRGNLGNCQEANLGKAALDVVIHFAPNFLQAVRFGSPADA